MMNDLRAAAAVPQCGRLQQLQLRQLLSRCFQFMPLLHICIVVWRSNADVNKRAIRDTMSLGHTSSYPVLLSHHRELCGRG